MADDIVITDKEALKEACEAHEDQKTYWDKTEQSRPWSAPYKRYLDLWTSAINRRDKKAEEAIPALRPEAEELAQLYAKRREVFDNPNSSSQDTFNADAAAIPAQEKHWDAVEKLLKRLCTTPTS